MKKLVFISFFILIFSNIFAQKPDNLPRYDNQRLHFGFSLGANVMDFTIHNSAIFMSLDSILSVEAKPQPGFNLQIISDLRLSQNFNLRFLPGLYFGQRDLHYIHNYWTASIDTTITEKVMKIESTFLEFPLLIKYRAQRYNDYRPYLIGGASVKYDLAAQKEIKDEDKPKVRLQRMDLYYQVGFGVDYYLPYFKFSTEIKLEVGTMNILKPDASQFTSAIERMNSKMIVISFHFE